MNKWLLRLLKQVTKQIKPKTSAWLIREIADRAKRARNQRGFTRKIKIFAKWTAHSMRQRGQVAKTTITNFVKAVNVLAEIWTSVASALLRDSLQPRIRLLRWLKPSLRNAQVSERIDLVLEEVRCRLIEEYWPPTRQRCDFIIAPAIN